MQAFVHVNVSGNGLEHESLSIQKGLLF
jgi:hypothetical protein